MPDALAQPLQGWHDFYLLVGGAAATLVGLMFVAISLGSRLITERAIPALRVPFLRQQHRDAVIDMHDWVWYLIVPLVSYLLFVGIGIGLLLGATQALTGLAFASILLLVNGIRNAWDMVVWFALKVEPPPR